MTDRKFILTLFLIWLTLPLFIIGLVLITALPD